MDIFELFENLKSNQKDNKRTLTMKYITGQINCDEYIQRMRELDRETDRT